MKHRYSRPCIGRIVELRRPDGKITKAKLLSIEMFSGAGIGVVGARISDNVCEEDVPPGTEVWLADQE